MIPDVTQAILLITYKDQEEEAVTRLSRVGYDNTLGFLKGGFDSWKESGKDFETTNRVTVEEVVAQHEKNQLPMIIDVRKKSEFDSEHLIDAVNIPLNEINKHLAEIPKDKPFLLHCAGGYRSMIASSILKQRGWNNFADIIGGFDEMKETSLPKSEYICPTTLL
jgi:rhodanese-related sulfurtransferase